VPAVDGIIFVDPKKSLVDINQAVGRVVRKFEGKAYGHVILPTIFEDTQITNETYAYLGAVLWHISQVDELLKDDISFARDRSLRQVMTTPNTNNIIELDTPDYINVTFDEFCNNLVLQAIDFSTLSKNYYTDEELNEMFKDCKSLPECRRLNPQATLRFVQRGLANIKFPNRIIPRYLTKEDYVELFKNCKTYQEAQQLDSQAWNNLKVKDYVFEIFPNWVPRTPRGFWNEKNNCALEAIKYQTKSEFQEKSGPCYTVARKNGWLEDICSHMVGNKKLSKEKCLEAAQQCSTKSEFMDKFSSEYVTAKNNGWFDEITFHIEDQRNGGNNQNNFKLNKQ